MEFSEGFCQIACGSVLRQLTLMCSPIPKRKENRGEPLTACMNVGALQIIHIWFDHNCSQLGNEWLFFCYVSVVSTLSELLHWSLQMRNGLFWLDVFLQLRLWALGFSSSPIVSLWAIFFNNINTEALLPLLLSNLCHYSFQVFLNPSFHGQVELSCKAEYTVNLNACLMYFFFPLHAVYVHKTYLYLFSWYYLFLHVVYFKLGMYLLASSGNSLVTFTFFKTK